ncbi:hypothetical protein DFH09DRAFT_1406865 [Mycena vulgaris]|nr:hypothetical protein DFH09DRAFT_1406865 [Mycena vulgaris]
MPGKIKRDTAYLRPMTVVHPVYHPGLDNCPHCGSDDVSWDSWNGTGSREVHGLRREETALGYQLRHEKCTADEGSSGTKNRCFVTTNPAFWEKWEHWKIPRGIPYFFSRCAVNRELFDLIIEFRPSTTSGGLAENIKQLHLLEYHQHSLEYLQAYQKAYATPGSLPFSTTTLATCSPPNAAGYSDTSITDDMIRDVYMAFVERTRSEESDEYLRNLRICLGADNTFKAAAKATVVDASKTRTKLMKGGILSVLNELNEIVAWRFCQSASPAEMFEILEGIRKRCEELGVDFPEMIVVDNCCQVKNEIHKALPAIAVCNRYVVAIINGTSNPHRIEVATEIRNAVLKNSASKGVLAQYWSKEEQQANVMAVYDKYCRQGGVWSAAAHNVHAAQLKHLANGCLSRPRQDVAADGSRIEGSHKGWNSIQRASASGLELQNALSHDFVLRRNIRVISARKPENAYGSSSLDAFASSTFGSHHTRLVNEIASVSNNILHTEAARAKTAVLPKALHATLKNVMSREVFGLVQSKHSATFGGLLTIKNEPEEDHLFYDALQDPGDPQAVLKDLNIDPALLFLPLQPTVVTSPIELECEIINTGASSNKRKEPDTPVETYADSSPVTSGGATLLQTKKQRFDEQPFMQHPFFNLNRNVTGSIPLPRAAPEPLPPTESAAGLATLNGLTELMPIPTHTRHLTRSEQIFSRMTGINPKSLDVARGKEFFLFMSMREEFGWESSDMTSKKWVSATGFYNERLGAPAGAAKSPRALSVKLGEIERAILNRIATKVFKSKKGDKTFWKKQCFSVPLIKVEDTASEDPKKTDAAKSTAAKNKIVVGELAPWPQPTGIFTASSLFHPLQFLAEIRAVYEKVVVEADINVTMEHEAFLLMLKAPYRIITSDGAVLLKLFAEFTIPAGDLTPDALFTEIDGCKYLRIDALQDSDLSIPSSEK